MFKISLSAVMLLYLMNPIHYTSPSCIHLSCFLAIKLFPTLPESSAKPEFLLFEFYSQTLYTLSNSYTFLFSFCVMQTAVGQVTVQRRPLQLSLMRSNDVDRSGGSWAKGRTGPYSAEEAYRPSFGHKRGGRTQS